MMDYIPHIAIAAGGIWTGYLVGQFTSIKEMNRRLSVLANERDQYKAGVDHWMTECDRIGESAYNTSCNLIEAKAEMARMADVIGKHQDKAHKCDKCNQFASKRKARTAELQAYVASKKAVS